MSGPGGFATWPLQPKIPNIFVSHALRECCRDRAAVDAHLRRRVDSGLLHLFPQAAPLHPLVPLQSAEAR
ncbi:MAG: hypothetical protein E5Y12_23925 [Mesorhizobium sp.]|nr:MAG: hypothetical protein E5Y12_23925 [Mesorhizobium sp.]